MTLEFFYRCDDCEKELSSEKVKGVNKLFATAEDYRLAPTKECDECDDDIEPYACKCE